MTVEQQENRTPGQKNDADRLSASRVREGEVLPMSFSQEQLWFLQRLDPVMTAYNLPRVLRLHSAVDADALERAFKAVIIRHAILRTQFFEQDGVPVQRVLADALFTLRQVDLSEQQGGRKEALLEREMEEVVSHVFDLGQAPALVAKLIKVEAEEYILVFCLHHIVSDGWSNPILAKDLSNAYRMALASEGDVHLPTLAFQYGDFALWQRDCQARGDWQRQLAYWNGYLGPLVPPLELPSNGPRRAGKRFDGADLNFVLPEQAQAAVRRFCKDEKLTLFVPLFAAWQVLLAKYSGQQDFAVGVPHAGRSREEFHDLVGYFVNPLVFRVRLTPELTWRGLCRRIRSELVSSLGNADLPFERLLADRPERQGGGVDPLFQSLFDFQQAGAAARLNLGGVPAEWVECAASSAKVDISLSIAVNADQVQGNLQFNVDALDGRTAARLKDYYIRILDHLVGNPEQAVGSFVLPDGQERTRLVEWGVNAVRYSDTQPVHRLIESQVTENPDAVALVFGEEELSYAELNARANRLAHRLIALGVAPEVRVGVALERSIELVVSLLAILKAGGAYVPLDPDYPAERLAYMAQDSGIRLLLTGSALRDRAPTADGVQVVEVDGLDLSREPAVNPDVPVSGENLCYVIYTSGSTGKPKGAANRHCSLYNRLMWMQQAYGLDSGDAVLQKTPYSFDVSVWEFFWPLMTGARLVVAKPGDHRDPARLVELIRGNAVTTLHFVPSMLQAFLAHEGIEACASLKRIVCSGEALPAAMQSEVFARLPGVALYNLYGPTEAAIDVTHWTCRDDGHTQVPIGKPISDTKTYVLDSNLNLAPQGAAGELYLGGISLARGYLNRSALTAERFVADPFSAEGARLYRTGDLVKWNADGALEYLGRIDHQVKIRGFRIELGEIEASLLRQPQVREAVVVAGEGPGGARLVGYVSLHAPIEAGQLRERLGRELPEYMVPGIIMVLDALPLNANGKIDRRALPTPEAGGEGEYEAPVGEVEETLAAIWSEVLKAPLDKIGRRSNFFELGGDSILSLQTVAKARSRGYAITPRQIFERQTIAQLATVTNEVDDVLRIDQGAATGEVALLPIQARFFEQPMAARHHYNQSVLLESQEPLSVDSLRAALAALVRHHDSLRLRYRHDAGGVWRQRYAEAGAEGLDAVLWHRRANDTQEIEVLCDAAQRSLDLERGPLLRAVAIEVADDNWRLLLAIHHLVVDGVSWRVLLEDLQTAYRQHRTGQAITLSPKTSSYQAWSVALQSHKHIHEAELGYWRALAGASYQIPVDDPHGSNDGRHWTGASVALDQATTLALLKEAPAAYRTQVNDILLAALGRALASWTGQDRFLVGLEGHGREDIFKGMDLTRTVGWFTCLYPVVLDGRGEPGETLKRVKESLRAIPNKGIGYGALRYLGSGEQREALAVVPAPQVVFNYLGQFDGSFDEAALWRPANERVGFEYDEGTERAEAFLINGEVYGGQLRVTLGYSAARHRTERIQALLAGFEAELRALIAHCTSGAIGVTPSDFPLAKLTEETLDRLPLKLGELEDLYPLSPMQMGMLFHSVYDEAEAATYVNQLRVDVEGLDAARFRAAWRAAIVRHEILRTGFLTGGDTPLQWVARQVDVPLFEYDWRGRGDLAAALDELAWSERQRGFELARPPLMRLVLVRTGESRYHFLWQTHHLLLDGWSTGQLIGEVLHHYHTGRALAGSPAPYRDYIAWLQRQGSGSISYWESLLRGLEDPTRFTDLLPQQEIAETGYREYPRPLSEAMSLRVFDYARNHRLTVNTLIQAAWALLLRSYTDQDTVSFGATTAGRPADLQGAGQMVGLFINTVPVIVSCRPEQSVDAWLQALQAQLSASWEHETMPLFEIQRLRGGERQALFDTIIVFENYPVDETLREGSDETLRFGAVETETGNHYPLTLRVNADERIHLDYLHERALVGDVLIERLAGQFEGLLRGLVDAPESALLNTLHLLPDPPAQMAPAIKGGADILSLWSRSASRLPTALAVSDGSAFLSFAALNARSDAVASALRERGVGAEVRVGVHAQRSVDLVVALLGILKAGGVYVPLDPALPAERLAYQVKDSGAVLVLAGVAPDFDAGVPVFALDAVLGDAATFKATAPHPAQAAYVIYTSGSTGVPKGVVASHGALANYVQGMLERLDLPEDAQSMAMVSTVAADLGHTVLFGALCSGRLLHLISAETAFDPDRFAAYMREYQVDVLKIVPSHLQALMSAANPADVLPGKRLVVGGETSSWALVDRIQALKPECRVVNHYGPTETTVGVMMQEAAQGNRRSATLPAGRPIAGGEVYVLDAWMRAVQQGAVGELYIGGAGLARGYQGRAGQTAERFVANPYGDVGERLYRTGDRVRLLEDGSVEFLGRVDDQVKIRGYRVELPEVAQALKAQDGVLEAEVIAREGEDGQRRLLGYVVVKAGAVVDTQQLKERIGQRLPDYMVPAIVVTLDALPLTANGKVDRKALPEPEQPIRDEYEAPLGAIEQTLAEIWAHTLRLERVGRRDNFFELGGDSILALQIIARARKQGVKIAPKQLMELQTIAAIAEKVEANVAESHAALSQVQDIQQDAPFGLMPVQRWFFEQAFESPQHWNQSILLSATEIVDMTALAQALEHVVAHHHALRLCFEPHDGVWLQRINPEAGVSVLERRLLDETNQAEAIRQTVAAYQATLTLDRPFKALWLEGGEGRTGRLLLSAHHLIVDAVSWRILVEDLQTAYHQLRENRPVALGECATSLPAWQQALEVYANSAALLDELPYWRSVVNDPQLPLSGIAQGSNRVADAATVTVLLDDARTEQLLLEVPHAYRTQINDILLTALARVLCRWAERESVLIELEGHGREQFDERVDVSRTVGWFTTLFPVKLEPVGVTPGESLKAIKEQLRAVPGKGLGYGVLRYLTEPGRVLAQAAYPQVTFNYLGQFDQGLDVGAIWRMARESVGNQRSPDSVRRTWLDVSASVQRGELRFAWTYSSQIHSEDEIRALAQDYLVELEALIEHCTGGARGATPSDFPLATLTQARIDSLPWESASVQDIYPLAPMQQGLLLHTLINPASGMYLMQDRYRIDSAVDVEAFRSAWDQVVNRYEVLRTGFDWQDKAEPVQIVYRKAPSPVTFLDWRDVAENEVERRIHDILQDELAQGFDLTRPPLMRLRLIQVSAQAFYIVQSFHHILMDAWCRSLLLREFFTQYERACGRTAAETPPARPYRDFIAWLQGQDSEQARRYWQEELRDFDTVTPLPYRRHAEAGARVAQVENCMASLSREQTAQIQSAAQQHQVTVNTFVQGAWALLLARMAQTEEVLFGVTVAGRPLELQGIQETVGLFINTIPLRLRQPRPDEQVSTWLQALLAKNLTMRQYEHVPLVEIQALSKVPRGNNLFDSIFVFENAPVDAGLVQQASTLNVSFKGNRTHTNYPITVVVVPGTELRLLLSYDAHLFAHDDVERLLDSFRHVLIQMLEHPQARVCDLNVLTSDTRADLLALCGGPVRAYPYAQGYAALFHEQAERYPNRIAARCLGESVRYADLRAGAAHIGAGLRRAGVGHGGVVALYADRGIELLHMILGVFEAGGVYFGLDRRQPDSRLARMLESSEAAVVVSLAGDVAQLEALLSGMPVRPKVLIYEELTKAQQGDGSAGLLPSSNPEQGAYVIYTSGSTGEPKGVVVTQRGMLNNQLSKIPYLGLGPEDVIAQTAALSFDVSVWQMLTALLCGACVEIVPDEVARDPNALLAHVRDTGVTVLQSVPSMIQAVLGREAVALPRLRWMLPTGEASTTELARQWFQRYPHIPLVNAYGPAECADDVALHRLDALEEVGSYLLPIGRPTDNTRLYVLDDELAPLPIGVAGELYVAGYGVGRGYLGRAALTAERFVADPLSAEPGERLYRTGDIARYRTDGVLEYLGRTDQQVKLRGQRLELGEIEAHLKRADGVLDGVVTMHQDERGERWLVAYAVPRDTALADDVAEVMPGAQQALKERLREHFVSQLPDFMVPSFWMFPSSLPLNANGKVDRRKLPSPDPARLGGVYEPPRGAVEEALAQIWAEVLRVPRVGRSDNFFSLGGHSLMAIQLMERVRLAGWAIEARQIFQHPRLQDLACAIADPADNGRLALMIPPNGIPEGSDAITPDMLPLVALTLENIRTIVAAVPGGAANVQDIYPLAPLQEGILFHHRLQPHGDPYILPYLIAFDRVDRLERFLANLNVVIARHDLLRTAVLWQGMPEPVQVIYRQCQVELEWIEMRALPDLPEDTEGRHGEIADRLCAYIRSANFSIDVCRAPMIRALVVRDEVHDRYLLQLPCHHLVLDHTTLDLLSKEIALVQQGRLAELPAPVPFRDFVARARLDAPAVAHEDYFRKMLADVDEPTTPFGLIDVQGDGSRIRQSIAPLDAELARRVREAARINSVTPAAIFHLAWSLVLARTSGRNDVVFGTLLFGRMLGGERIDHAVGMFINTLPIRIGLYARGVSQCLTEIHNTLVTLLEHESASLALAQRCSGLPGGTPLFSSILNYRYSLPEEKQPNDSAWEGVTVLGGEARTNYPSVFSIDDQGYGFRLAVSIDQSISAERVHDYACRAIAWVVDSLLVNPNCPVTEFECLALEERSALYSWSCGERLGTQDRVELVHRLFESRVKADPDSAALVFGDEELTYAELNTRANRLAHYLIELGVSPEVRVGVALERSIELVVTLLAILKAGGAYVPLDPDYPAERLAYMADDSGIALTITHSALWDGLPTIYGVQVVEIDGLDLSREPTINPDTPMSGENLCYVIYTSGSTGKPKGAQLCHSNVCRLLAATDAWFRFVPSDVWTLFHSYAFDFSVWEMFGALCTGGRLVVVPYWVSRSPSDFLALLRGQQVTVLNQTPSAFGQLIHAVEQDAEGGQGLALRHVIFGGEALEPEMLRPWMDRFGDQAPRLINMYGITETSVHVTYRPITRADLEEGRRSPVGVNIPDLGLKVLDGNLNLAPIGVPGELHVSGDGLARGYLNRSALTAERFIADPFDEAGGRLYRTGDLVRWNAEGALEYLGRIDHQVKIRGFRIELGEIEASLLRQPQVREAVVVAGEGPGGTRLVGYVSLHAPIEAGQLRERLGRELPEYMVPSLIIELAALPLNANGKIDRKALPVPEYAAGGGEYEAPQGEVEEVLAVIWAEVLAVSVEQVGRQSDFFALGGNSIALMRVQMKLQERFGVRVPMRDYFERPLLGEIGNHIRVAYQHNRAADASGLAAFGALLDASED